MSYVFVFCESRLMEASQDGGIDVACWNIVRENLYVYI